MKNRIDATGNDDLDAIWISDEGRSVKGAPSIYAALNTIRAELVHGMSVTIDEDGVVIQIGKEKFQVDDSAPLDTENQVCSFFNSASWLAGMRLVEA